MTEKRRRRKRQVLIQKIIIAVVALAIVVFFSRNLIGDDTKATKESENARQTELETKTANPEKTAENNENDEKDNRTVAERMEAIRKTAVEKSYPEELVWLLDNNEETLSFVEDYEEKKDLPAAVDLGEDYKEGTVPELYQYDERWGYTPYGDTLFARSGCGPTALSMVFSYVNRDTTITPREIAYFSQTNGYVDEAHGTTWQLMKDAASHWNISVAQGSPFDENWIKTILQSGTPIICSMGPGDFTDTGHFIVLTAYKDGEVSVHDPFSKVNTSKTWTYAHMSSQVKAMWAFYK